jgi:hypothetical protein
MWRDLQRTSTPFLSFLSLRSSLPKLTIPCSLPCFTSSPGPVRSWPVQVRVLPCKGKEDREHFLLLRDRSSRQGRFWRRHRRWRQADLQELLLQERMLCMSLLPFAPLRSILSLPDLRCLSDSLLPSTVRARKVRVWRQLLWLEQEDGEHLLLVRDC